jgi:SAM-dependent methyltransferase
LAHYRFELEHPEKSIRSYEWKGIANVVNELTGESGSVRRWLDFGCGNGGLVRHLREREVADAVGFDEGSIVADARARGIPILNPGDLVDQEESFDVVTAIEVIEHTLDPVAELRRIRRMLRPGGLLFLTTGNAEPYANRLSHWRYVVPEIHISYFEPRTLERALTSAGFRPERCSRGGGFNEILKFKLLKNLRVRRRSPLTDWLPPSLIGPIADRLTRLSHHPIGWAS